MDKPKREHDDRADAQRWRELLDRIAKHKRPASLDDGRVIIDMLDELKAKSFDKD